MKTHTNLTIIGRTQDSAKSSWGKISHKYDIGFLGSLQFLSSNVNAVDGKRFVDQVLILTEGYQENPVYEAISYARKNEFLMVIDESRANIVQSVAAAEPKKEPTNEQIYTRAYSRLSSVIANFIDNSEPCSCEITEHAYNDLRDAFNKIDNDVVKAFNLGEMEELRYTDVTLQDKFESLAIAYEDFIQEQYHSGVLETDKHGEQLRKLYSIKSLECKDTKAPVNEDAEIKYMKVNAILSPEQLHKLQDKYQRELGPTHKIILLDSTVDIMDSIKAEQSSEAFLTITLEDINAVPQVFLEGKEVKSKQAVRFEYQTRGHGEPIPNYIFIQSLLSGGDKKPANVMTQEYNKPLGVSPLSSIDLDYNPRHDWENGRDNTMKLMQDAYNSGRVTLTGTGNNAEGINAKGVAEKVRTGCANWLANSGGKHL